MSGLNEVGELGRAMRFEACCQWATIPHSGSTGETAILGLFKLASIAIAFEMLGSGTAALVERKLNIQPADNNNNTNYNTYMAP